MPKKFVFVHRVGGSASLVTICKKNVEKSVYSSRIETAVKLLNKGLSFIYSFYILILIFF